MTGDGLLNSILKERFDSKWDDPSQFWFSGLVEGLIYKGDERHLSVNFFPLLSPPSRPLTEARQLSPTVPPSDQKFNIRVWNMMHAGLVHQTGVVLHRHKQVLFPKVEFNLDSPYKTDFVRFKECEFYLPIKRLLHTRELGDNIQLVQYDNVSATDGMTYDHVIIPCAEIARFYFFNSSNIVEPLLKPGALNKSSNQLYVAERSGVKYDKSNQPFHVVILEKSMTRTDAAVIARIAFSEVAQSAAAILNASCLERINYRSFIKCPFPFSEHTTLHATCMSLNQNGKRVLLVMELLTCTAPFPFEFLAVGQDIEREGKDGSKNGNTNNSGNTNNNHKKKKPVVDITSPPKTSSENEGGAYDLEDLTVFTFRERFKALDTKKILKLKQDALVKNKPSGKAFRVIKTVSINSKKNGGPGGARISSKNKEGKKPSVKKFTPDETKQQDQVLKVDRFEMMYLIKDCFEKRGYSVSFHKWVKVSDDSDFTYFYEEDMNTESRWPFLDFAEGILRRGLCLCIINLNHTFYLLDVEVAFEESSLKVFALKNFEEMKLKDSEEVLTCLSENGGRLSKITEGFNKPLLPNQFITSRFYHYAKWDSEKYTEQILKIVERGS